MKNVKRRLAISAALIVGFGSLSPIIFEARGEGSSLEGLEIEDVYNIGDLLYIPKTAALKMEDKSVKIVSSSLVYPSGASLASSSYNLDAYGNYSLELSGEDGSSYSKSFSVYQDVYSLANSESTIDYGSLNASFENFGYPNGLRLKMMEGDTFRFAQPIDLSKSTYQKLISWNVIDVLNSPAIRSIVVKLTDAYDPYNYITITNSKGNWYYLNHFSVSYNGGRSVGLDRDDSGPISIGGSVYRISSEGGTVINGNQPLNGTYDDISYYLDTSDPSRYRIYVENDKSSQSALVSELNNPDIYSDTFAGFKTGLVYLSLTVSDFNGTDYAPIEIADIAGISGDDLNPLDYYKDSIAPVIELSSEEKANIMGGVELTVPEARAYDETGLRGGVSASVWYGYDTSSRNMITVRNGKFLPSRLGVYTIIYEAIDVYGNKSQERVDLSASSFGEEGISFQLSPLSNLKAGTSIKLDNFTASSLNDDCQVEIELTYPNGVKEIHTSEDSFVLNYSGAYHAVYRYKDSFYSGEKEMDFLVEENTDTEFVDKNVALPNYFMKGASYTIDVPKAYSYGADGKSEVDILSYVSFDGGAYAESDVSDLTITGHKSVRFRFAPKTNPGALLETEEKPIVDTGWDGKKVDLTKYFVGDFLGDEAMASDGKKADYVRYKSQINGTAKMEFVNKLLLSGFSFDFQATSFDKLTVRLLSYYDHSKQIEIVFDTAKISVNGRSQTPIDDWGKNSVSIFYSATASVLSVAGASFELENPFEKDSFLLEVEAQGATSDSYIDISMVGNQAFRSGSTRDRVAPMTSIVFPAEISSIGDNATIHAPNVADVLTPSSDATTKMDVLKNVGGNVTTMKDKNSGKELSGISDFSHDYEIVFDGYGSYIITYAISDLAGNAVYGGLKGMVKVLDREAPVISDIPESHSIKAGVLSDLPIVSATDNITKEGQFEIWHLIYDAESRLVAQALNGDKVTINEKGRYKVYVTCQDEEGNIAYGEYTLNVQ